MDYPANFPEPLVASFGITAESGLSRVYMESGDYKQRRRNNFTLPERFSLQFAIPYELFNEWQTWVNANAYESFNINVVSSASALGDICATRALRFISDLDVSIGGGNFVYVSVAAETMASVFDFYSSRFWVIAEMPEPVEPPPPEGWQFSEMALTAAYRQSNVSHILFKNNVWLAIVRSPSTPNFIRSSDGVNWSDVTPPGVNSGTTQPYPTYLCGSTGGVWVAVYPDGYASRSIDNGVTWAALPRWLNTTATATTFPGNSLATDSNGNWVVGFNNGQAAHSGDDGATWTPLTPGLNSGSASPWWRCFAANSNGVFIACGTTGYCARSVDGGVTWAAAPRALNCGSFNQIGYGVEAFGNNFVAVFTGGYASRSTDQGATWGALVRGLNSGFTTTDFNNLGVDNTGVFVAIGGGGIGARSIDGGATWSGLPLKFNNSHTNNSPSPCDGYSVGADNAGNWMTGFSSGHVSVSSDDGATWERGPLGLSQYPTTADATAMHAGVDNAIVAYSTSLAITRDGGETWITLLSGLNSGNTGAFFYAFANNGARWVVVGNTWCAQSDDDGWTWFSLPRGIGNGTTASLRSIGVNKNTGVWVCGGDSGRGSRSIDNGVTWASLTTNGFNSGGVFAALGVAAGASNVWVVVLDQGYASRSIDDGATWTALPRGLGADTISAGLLCIDTDGNGVFIAGGSDGDLRRSIDNGATWTAIPFEDLNTGFGPGSRQCLTIKCNGSGTWRAGFQSGYASVSVDNGVTWQGEDQGLNSGTVGNDLDSLAVSADGQTWYGAFDGGYGARLIESDPIPPGPDVDENWIIAGTPDNVALNFIIGGRPSRPAILI